MDYPGDFYAPIGDFLRERYLDYGFAKGTVQEIDFLTDLLALPRGSRILDVGCGAGRHSLELARRGYRAVGVDISAGLIEVARAAAMSEKISADFHVQDARRLELPAEFDAAICLCEGAFGLAGDDTGHRQVLASIHRALCSGAPFVLTAIQSFSAVRRMADSAVGSFDPYTSTSVSNEIIRSPENDSRNVDIYTTAFNYRELKWLLEEAGFVVEAGYGCEVGRFAAEPIGLDSTEIMVVARKRLG